MIKKWLLIPLFLSLFFSACAPLSGTLDVGIVTETIETNVPPTATPEQPTSAPVDPTHTPEPDFGPATVTGNICYPSEFIPRMTAYFQNNATGSFTELEIAENQVSYTVELEAGDYVAFAYPEEQPTAFGGMYSAAVPCGLTVECTDHTLLVFTVAPGETTEGIDICDWYAQDQVPAPPGEAAPSGPYQEIAGLVYSDLPAEETWRIDPNGFPQRVYPERDAKPSPTRDRVLLDRDDGIWLVDLLSGEETNLTPDNGRLEGHSQWWPANPAVIVFNSVDAQQGIGMSAGQVSTMLVDGSNYQVLEERSSFLPPALSPDGITITYDIGNTAWLYRLDSGKDQFNFEDYGLDVTEEFKIANPSWSPDGHKLAWWVGDYFGTNGEWNLAIAVFDLQAMDYQFIHQYWPIGGNWMPPVQWSPDGQWLAFTTQGQGRIPELMVMRTDGSESISLGSGADPLWSPEGSKLIFLRPDPQGGSFLEDRLIMVERDTWQPVELDLPPGSRHIQWANP